MDEILTGRENLVLAARLRHLKGAGRIAILHQGRIIANGTLAELKRLFPPATVTYVEKQPTLEEIFLAITGNASAAGADGTDT